MKSEYLFYLALVAFLIFIIVSLMRQYAATGEKIKDLDEVVLPTFSSLNSTAPEVRVSGYNYLNSPSEYFYENTLPATPLKDRLYEVVFFREGVKYQYYFMFTKNKWHKAVIDFEEVKKFHEVEERRQQTISNLLNHKVKNRHKALWRKPTKAYWSTQKCI